MKPEKLICNSSNITYDKGYIALWCKDYVIPDTLDVEGDSLLKKDHFHVSLLCVKNILEVKPDSEDEVLKHFCNFLQNNEFKFEGFTKEFRLATRGERKSVVAMCKISNLHKLAEYMTEKTGVTVAPQPAHVTIYTLQPNVGIGLNSPAELKKNQNQLKCLRRYLHH